MTVIVLAGMIGAGKTTWATRLSQSLGTDLFLEPVEDNPILPKYYEDRDRYGFALQIFFLNKRFRLIKQAYKHRNNVLDRSIYEDALFTKINVEQGSISPEEYDVYMDLLDNMMEELDGMPQKAPDLLIYLDRPLESIMSNIISRGREYEQPTPDNGLSDYYALLHSKYRQWFEEYDKGPKMKICADEFDILEDEELESLVLEIITYMNGR